MCGIIRSTKTSDLLELHRQYYSADTTRKSRKEIYVLFPYDSSLFRSLQVALIHVFIELTTR